VKETPRIFDEDNDEDDGADAALMWAVRSTLPTVFLSARAGSLNIEEAEEERGRRGVKGVLWECTTMGKFVGEGLRAEEEAHGEEELRGEDGRETGAEAKEEVCEEKEMLEGRGEDEVDGEVETMGKPGKYFSDDIICSEGEVSKEGGCEDFCTDEGSKSVGRGREEHSKEGLTFAE
jgi:hypothetical protein